MILHKTVRCCGWLSPHLLELWPLQGFSAEYVATELGEYLTLQMEVRFKCTCYIILQALESCRQCFYGVSTSAMSAMHYTVRMHGLWRYSTSHWPGVKQVHVRIASNMRQQIPKFK